MSARRTRLRLASLIRLAWIVGTVALCLGNPIGAALAQSGTDRADVLIEGIRFTGQMNLLDQSEQSAFQDEAIGQPLDLMFLQSLVDRVTGKLQAKGYVLAWAVLPPQDVTEGVVEIELRQGSVEAWEFRLDETVRIEQDRLEAIAHQVARPGEPITRQGLERALMIMGDQAGVAAHAVLQSGGQPGTTRIIVQVAEAPQTGGRLTGNNYGSRTTGGYQGELGLQLRDTLRQGEQIDLSATFARGTGAIRIGGDVGVHPSGLRLGARASSYNYSVVEGDGATAELTGRTRSWGAGIRYPFVRSRATNVWGSADYDHKWLQDFAMGAVTRERRVSVISLELSGDDVDQLGGGGQTVWRIGVSRGNVELVQGADHDGTAGPYAKVAGSIRRLQHLGRGYSLVARLSWQATGGNLDASEGFALGGPFGVRAYPVGEGSGDAGWLGSLELRYDMSRDMSRSSLPGEFEWAVFVDRGYVQLYRDPPPTIPTATGQNTYFLTGWGASATWRINQRTRVELGWAHALGENPGRTIFDTNADGTTDRSRLWLEVSVTF